MLDMEGLNMSGANEDAWYVGRLQIKKQHRHPWYSLELYLFDDEERQRLESLGRKKIPAEAGV